jgi:protein SCO1
MAARVQVSSLRRGPLSFVAHCARRRRRLLCTGPTGNVPVPSARPTTGSGHYAARPSAGAAKPSGMGQAMEKGPISWRHFAITAVIGGTMTAVFKYMELKLADEKFRAVGKAALGGPFELLDHDGEVRSDADYRGEWMLLYFGFTHCPDICPNELNKITNVVNALDQSMKVGPIVRPILITVDPRRDSVAKMNAYIKQFHSRFVGLTGTEEQVRQVTKAYRVYFNPTNDDDENYLVDHSIIAYLINPAGEFVAFYGQDELYHLWPVDSVVGVI